MDFFFGGGGECGAHANFEANNKFFYFDIDVAHVPFL